MIVGESGSGKSTLGAQYHGPFGEVNDILLKEILFFRGIVSTE